ncbi:TonB-dependent receptor [Mucilaginibacter myungsuensis]|uniref:TonB-dependent receptor n=1 Tax=Mucilaginibacter myungsuensis TaxID=649104 RepID=A0A929KUL9_9SPHI|nr:TonB-dependent receptor [Mucilaginibacter myungsuensis]MBE9660718.1 TonB-dependent receptor [Mucilaginibacter myungsuensis]MDN3600763.1 TonB-dependent receptor [Mucilaginibacter myungsuensis]
MSDKPVDLILNSSRMLVLAICMLLTMTAANAQSKFTISGTVKDAQSGETLIGATITTAEQKQKGVASNGYGFYSLSLPSGKYTLLISYVGYRATEIMVDLQKNMVIKASLNPDAELQEVTISAEKVVVNDNISNPQMGLNKLEPDQISNIPVLLGEKDILKTIQLLPGVKSTGEANSGIYIRGGSADQNLVLLDGAQVYNATHLFGFFSIFNSDAIKDVSLYKGGMPAAYGGRISSVLDIKMDEGNDQKFGMQGGIGLISSRLKAEGPLVKNKSSFMISARRTYADAFLKLSGDSVLEGSSLYFYDINAKVNYQLGEKDRVYLSGYYGKDNIGLKDNFNTNWGNAMASLRWNHIYGSKLFGNTSLIYSNYNYKVKDLEQGSTLDVSSRIRDMSFKEDMTWFAGDTHRVNFGLDITQHQISPDDTRADSANSSVTKAEQRKAYEAAVYVSDEWKIGEKLDITYGARLNWFSLRGPGTFYDYSANNRIGIPKTYSDGTTVKDYLTVEPRLTAGYTINAQNAVKLSFNRNSQNIHLLSNSTAALPSDIYVLSSNNIKPGIGEQLALGYYRNLKKNRYELSAEVYYKRLSNQIDYKDNAQLLINNNIEADLIYGVGRAYGVELFAKKKYGRLNGWIGYALSRVERRFNEVNNGAYFPARQDRTHDLSVVGVYKIKERLTFSAVFVYGTGNSVTFPDGKYRVGGVTTYYYSARNSYRLPANHRMDIGVTLDGKNRNRLRSSWTFGIYNLYNRKNPYSVVFKDTNDNPPRTEAVATSLFGIIPSVTWNFKF